MTKEFPMSNSETRPPRGVMAATPRGGRRRGTALPFEPGHSSGVRAAAFVIRWWHNALKTGALLTVLFTFAAQGAGVRLRDLVMVSGARDNQLVGYGLVAGLAGEGDKDPVYTKQTIANMLQRYGVNIPAATL